MCLEVHDLATSKYVAGREKDRELTRELSKQRRRSLQVADLMGSALADVDYETSHGTVPVHGLYLSAERVHRLVQGGGIPLRYMKSDPHRYLEEGVELPSGIGLLILGFAASGVAVFAHRLLRREAGLG